MSGLAGSTNKAVDTVLDAEEVKRFDRIAAEWWDEGGKFKPLHKLGPARLAVIREAVCSRFGRDASSIRPYNGLSAIDIGCGGGLIAEPIARLGAAVCAIDPSPETIEAARRHATLGGLDIKYRVARAEHEVAAGRRYDIVLCLEVLEHVPDPAAFLKLMRPLVAPGGLLILSTINRTLKAWALAIVGAELVLRWLPAGTHQWDRFITPDELRDYVGAAGLKPDAARGIVYSPLRDEWSPSDDIDVNYMLTARD
ncbi:MAG: bifunctional 2-polyprenyl-6-hydroxyphenol methylase/3-demethylubiquinol 3-O-methyltransferase UbiG [Hyphomicrobiaceae bacterium]|nr:MAG: bifunctional 2-polyprenyl-6-hydroxyphenol methylase/3-demethylubiquinol 3-O-methyltransferase UbiG [Hyphomicrobiaceae bacterium]